MSHAILAEHVEFALDDVEAPVQLARVHHVDAESGGNNLAVGVFSPVDGEREELFALEIHHGKEFVHQAVAHLVADPFDTEFRMYGSTLFVAAQAADDQFFVVNIQRSTLKCISDAVSNQFIASTREIGYSAILEDALYRQGIEMDPVMDIGSVEGIVRILRGGFGVALLPEYVVSDLIETGELAKLDIKDHGIRMNSYYLCSKDRWINPVMKAFIRMVQH